MLQWVIIGAGIHGTYLSHLLISQGGVDRDDIRVLDPHDEPLANWTRNTASCGMRFLRSPATHNIDIGILSLHQFAKSDAGSPYAEFVPPYFRPSLELFQRHCRHVIAGNGLDRIRITGRAVALKKHGGVIEIETTADSLQARHVILAIGLSEQPCWPAWAKRLRIEGARIFHVFDPDFSRERLARNAATVVLGGGSSAVQTALTLTREIQGPVVLLSRHDLRKSVYDFNPCWIGPKCLRSFFRIEYGRRRSIVDTARMRGSVPGEVLEDLWQTMGRADLQMRRFEGLTARVEGHAIHLKTERQSIWADQVVLATGFEPARPGGTLIDQAIREFQLKYESCGFPVLGADLRWAPHIFVSGPLAELQVGPCARNIVGARNAGRSILRAIASD